MKTPTRLNYVGILLSKRDDLCDAGAANAGIGTLLILYCFRELNGGVIEGCRGWNQRRWIFTCGLDEAPQGDCPGLWHWEGDDLVVDLYSAELEQAASAASDSARAAADARWAKERRRRGKQAADAPAAADRADAREDAGENSADASAHATACATADAINLIKKIPPLPSPGTETGGEEREREVSESDDGGLPAAEWVRAVAAAHPVLALMDANRLPDDVQAAAAAAYARCANPQKVLADIPLLQAYLSKTKIDETKRGRKLFRPQMPKKFFESLEQTIVEAKLWARETGWKKPESAGEQMGGSRSGLPKPVQREYVSDEDVTSMFAELRKAR